MVTYKFKLINSKVPVVRGKSIITDSNVGGTKNTYRVYKKGFDFFGVVFLSFVGTKSFLRPYQSVWDKRKHRLPPVYWGKGPMLNMWLILSNDYEDIKNVKVLLPECDTTKHTTKIFNVDFKSQDLAKNLNLNQTFYQSKFEKNE